jgi:hypothetical protein
MGPADDAVLPSEGSALDELDSSGGELCGNGPPWSLPDDDADALPFDDDTDNDESNGESDDESDSAEELSDEFDRSSAAFTEAGDSDAFGWLVTESEIALTACKPSTSAKAVAKAQPAMSSPVRRTPPGWRTAARFGAKRTLNRG